MPKDIRFNKQDKIILKTLFNIVIIIFQNQEYIGMALLRIQDVNVYY